ncbi:MAG: bifunctional serine/threonine-protein kinase/formylglycine-generating enzyme family protein [Polyangiaceae bacterium]
MTPKRFDPTMPTEASRAADDAERAPDGDAATPEGDGVAGSAPKKANGSTPRGIGVGQPIGGPGISTMPPDGAPRSERTGGDASGGALLDPAWRRRHERYTDLGLIGKGGMGEVRRVRDTALERVMAMKILPWAVVDEARWRQRFLDEMRATAALQHPGIVAVHDSGELPDGRLWFTMKVVRGETLGKAIVSLHSGANKWSLRRLIEVFARACEAVAYAHSRGVVHRDLKPDNLMIGEFGEVLVMDWGLVKNLRIRKDITEPSIELDSIDSLDSIDDSMDSLLTQPGDIMGTPAYMSPEQARGEIERLRPATDVYALGAVLYEILCGRPPYIGTVRVVCKAVLSGQPPPPPETSSVSKVHVPRELAALCMRAMSRAQEDRYADAAEMAAEVRNWLDGAYKRDRAFSLVEEARGIAPKLERLQERARDLDRQARDLLGQLPSYAPSSAKAEAWSLQDRAAQLRREAAVEEVGWFQTLRSALNEVPDLAEAHELLADYYRARLAAAEEAHETDAAVQYEALLRAHDLGKHAAFLNGHATVSLVTEPEGAVVSLYRYVEVERVLVQEYAGELGLTPLRNVPITKGSYVLRVRAPGHHELVYPVFVGRGEHWSGVAPGESEPRPIRMFRAGELSADEVYVPAGWFIAGGDAQLSGESLPRMRIWCEPMVVRRFPVTNREYLEFLNDLVANGLEEEAERRCPRGGFGLGDAPIFLRDGAGSYHASRPDEPHHQELDWPVVFVDWHNACAYAAWFSRRSGKPWRLLNELEWEKAARGVDGRLAPWGDHVDPGFACMLGSLPSATRVTVSSFPVDQSPYGVRGLAGNVRDWCINVWKADGPEVQRNVVTLDPASDEDDSARSARGGSWTTAPVFCRLAARFADKPSWRFGGVGFRLARSV